MDVLKLTALMVLVALASLVNRARAAENPPPEFMDVAAARKAIIDDAKEPYFAKFADAEMSAKTALEVPDGPREERLAEVKRQYQDAVREFTPEEKETIQWYVDQLAEPLQKDYPLFAALPWKFIKVKPELESGMPHTRGDYIVLAEGVLKAMAGIKESAPPEAAMARMGGMLVHEKLHVLQRRKPKRFEDLYIRVWGFEKMKEVAGAERLRSRWIVNPDGPDVNWVMPIKGEGEAVRYVWPLILFSDPKHPTLHQMQMTAVSLQKKEGKYSVELNDAGEPVTEDLLGVSGYTEKFFPSTYIYHPNEAAADLFSRIVVMDHFNGKDAIRELPEPDRIEAALEPLREWFKKNLKP